MNVDIDMYEYAIEYAQLGIRVFPLLPNGKTPAVKHWQDDATTDAAVIKAWWQKWPNANIGIATGQGSGGLYVIDCDKHHEGIDGIKAFQDWELSHGTFPLTWMAHTGSGGAHIFFRDTEKHGNRAGIIPAVDFRGDGGYIVAPPSMHPNGTRYRWDNGLKPGSVDLAKANDTVKAFLNIGKEPTAIVRYTAPQHVPQGERNDTLFRFACMMQAKGAGDDTIYAATLAENTSKCNPPLEEFEVRKIVDNVIASYKKGQPIYNKGNGEAIQGQREPRFKADEHGRILKTIENMCEAIEFSEELYGSIKYNELANSIWVYGSLPWDEADPYRAWTNVDDDNLKNHLEKRFAFTNSEKIMSALTIVSARNTFNPVVEKLEQIHATYKDNCEGAIRKLLPAYMGAEDTDYNHEVMKLYMLGAISRAYHPGCKFDYSLILYGAQGFGKSEFLRHLAINPEWFNDNFNTFEGKEATENLAGMWIVEMAELKALKSAKDSETFKAFLTSRVDQYRAPYARRAEQRPRMCVFAGTTNNKSIFVDKTGNRRFLPVIARKGCQTKDLFGDQEQVMLDFELAWAEAVDIFKKADGQPQLILSKTGQKEALKMQEEFSEDDYRVGVIKGWLDETGVYKVCVPQIIEKALKMDLSRVTKQSRREILEIMDNEIEGWSRAKTKDRGRMRFENYGSQIAFMKDEIC